MAHDPKENPGQKKPWKDAVREEQQFLYEVFGDRDWDCYKESEMEYLERNVGHAIYGPPKELPNEENGSTGYSEKELDQIRKLCATIKKHSKYSSKCNDSDVLVSVIYVCLQNGKEKSFPVPIFRIPNCDPKDKSKECPDQFVDCNCRVYEDWLDFLNNNQLPKCNYCYPRGGVYDGDDNDQVIIEFGKTPANKAANVVCSALDTASSVVMVGGMGVSLAALFTTVAAPVMAASAVGAVGTGVYGIGRSIAALVDRDKHKQSVGVTDAEARNCWLSVAGNALGVASGQAVRLLTKATQSGQVVGKAGLACVNILNYGSLAVNGIGLVNNFATLCEKYNSKELTSLEVFQFASSCLFFTMSAVNIKTANAIVRETQSQVIGDFEASLRSNRHRRMFRRVAKQTRGEDGNNMQGNAKVIKGINHISNKDDFFAGLVRVQKQVGKSEAKVTLTDRGTVEINGHMEVHPMEFSGIDKVQRQVMLDATRNVRQGTWTQEQFNQEMQTFCQKHDIVLGSQRAETVASIKAISSRTSKKRELCNLNDWQIDTVTFCMLNFAKEHHQKILSIAIELSEMLGYKRTAQFLSVVQFVTNYIEQVAADRENRYKADLQSAQISQGQNFNREQFDNEYHSQGKSTENFIRSVLNNWNTYELLPKLKAAYQCMFPPEANTSGIEGNDEDESVVNENNSDTSPHTESDSSPNNMADPSPEMGKSDHSPNSNLDGEGEGEVVRTDASSVAEVCSIDETAGADQEACVLYKEHRDFKKYGDLSHNEIYMIVKEVTGLYLYEGNTKLYQHGEATFVSVTDPHIEPLTVMICSDRHNDTVTADLIV